MADDDLQVEELDFSDADLAALEASFSVEAPQSTTEPQPEPEPEPPADGLDLDALEASLTEEEPGAGRARVKTGLENAHLSVKFKAPQGSMFHSQDVGRAPAAGSADRDGTTALPAHGQVGHSGGCCSCWANALATTRIQTEAELRWVFNYFDANQNGSIDEEELRAVLLDMHAAGHSKYPTPHQVESMMKEADTDGDGSIDFDEFGPWPHPPLREASA